MRFTLASGILVLSIIGCDDKPDPHEAVTNRLLARIQALEAEKAELSKTVPSEQPKVVAELSEAKQLLLKARAEFAELKAKAESDLAIAKNALTRAEGKIPEELVSLGDVLTTMKAKIAALEQRCNGFSLRGHRHTYDRDKHLIFPPKTDPD